MVERFELDDSANEGAIDATAPSVAQGSSDEAGDNVVSEETQSRPEWLPEKFQSPEAMAAAYAELEHKQGAAGTEQDGEPATEAQTLTPDTLQKYSEKYYSDGLTPADYADLDKMGVSKELVGQYAAGMSALQDQQANVLYQEAGGTEEYGKMVEWATASFSENEISAYNAAIVDPQPETRMMALKGLKSRYAQVVGHEPQLAAGSTTGSGVGAFESAAQLTQAMKDPRYAKDPAYRNEVIQKLKNSSQF